MLDTVKINHVQHISFTQPRLTDAVSVILSELLSYEHPSNGRLCFILWTKFCLYWTMSIKFLQWLPGHSLETKQSSFLPTNNANSD